MRHFSRLFAFLPRRIASSNPRFSSPLSPSICIPSKNAAAARGSRPARSTRVPRGTTPPYDAGVQRDARRAGAGTPPRRSFRTAFSKISYCSYAAARRLCSPASWRSRRPARATRRCRERAVVVAAHKRLVALAFLCRRAVAVETRLGQDRHVRGLIFRHDPRVGLGRRRSVFGGSVRSGGSTRRPMPCLSPDGDASSPALPSARAETSQPAGARAAAGAASRRRASRRHRSAR